MSVIVKKITFKPADDFTGYIVEKATVERAFGSDWKGTENFGRLHLIDDHILYMVLEKPCKIFDTWNDVNQYFEKKYLLTPIIEK